MLLYGKNNLKVYDLKNIFQTGREMAGLVKKFSDDVKDFDSWSFYNFFVYCCLLPYKPDPKGIELLQRPKISLNPAAKYRDCDDKHILLGAWMYRKNIPFCFVAQSQREDKKFHHVCIMDFANKNIDCTYEDNLIKTIPVTAQVKISEWIR
jgi:hypothetical protein